MATVKIRHLVSRVRRDGTVAYHFQAKVGMAKYGIGSEALGTDMAAAIERAEYLNGLLDEARKEKAPSKALGERPGSIKWLIERYKASSWYLKLADSTQEKGEAHLARIAASPLASRMVGAIQRADCRDLYERTRAARGPYVAKDRLKWLRRILSYSVELGVRKQNPALKMEIEEPPHRVETWTLGEVEAFKKTAVALSYGSWALAVQLGYDTSQRLSDILSLTWHQFDREGLTFTQGKTGREVWVALSEESLRMLAETPKRSIHVLTGEVRGRPIKHRSYFGRVFREIRGKTAMRQHLTFHDLRRTAATEISTGGGNIEHVTGHRPGSNAIRRYVVPNKEASRRAQAARIPNKSRGKV